MDIFFQDPKAIPLPPEEVRIIELRAEPWPDNRRVKIFLEITPFQKRPSGEIYIKDKQYNEIASVSIIETIDSKMEFTLHLRGADTQGKYTVFANVFYLDETEILDEEIEVLSSQRERFVVDQAETEFEI